MDRKGYGESDAWRAGGHRAIEAHLISRDAGGAVYGGTPSDESVIAAIS